MHVEVEHLSRYLAGWIDAVRAAGTAYRDWQRDGEVASLRSPRLSDVVLPGSALGDVAIRPVLGMPL
jgi:hypothetical protein